MLLMRPVSVLLAVLVWALHAHSGVRNSFLELTISSDPAHGQEAEAHGQEAHAAEDSSNHEAHADHPVVGHARQTDEHVAEHVEQGTKSHGTGVNGPCPGNQSANSVAIGLMASVTLMPLIIFMTMTKAAKGAVSDLTFHMIDLSTSIFLAVLWFSASADVLEFPTMRKMFPYSEEVFAFTQVILLYVVTMAIAYYLRENKYALITFCGCAGHYIAFAAIKATGESQHVVGSFFADTSAPYASFVFCIVVFGMFAGVSTICFLTWRRHVKDEELHLAVEELELDIVGLVLSFALMQAVRHMLTGHYPSEAHLFLQQHGEALINEVALNAPHVQHTPAQRVFMLVLAVGLTIVCCASLNPLEEAKRTSGYWGHKAYHVLQVVLVMCVAWAYLLWGEWQFYETFFHGDKMFGKMVFAVIATAICLIFIIVLAYATADRYSNARGYAELCVMAFSLVVAWSWEHCFHTAIGVLAEQYQVGYGGMVPKLIIALAIPLFILPGYVVFVKPIVNEVDERVHQEENDQLRKQLSGVMYTEPEGEAAATAAT